MQILLGKATEEIVRQNEVVNYHIDWIWEVNAQGCYTFCSQGSPQMIGRKPEEVIGRTPFDFMPTDDVDGVKSRFAEIMQTHQPFANLLNRSLRSDGTWVMLETNGLPMFDANGHFCGYRGTDRDVTPVSVVMSQRLLHLEALYTAAPVALALLNRDLRFVAVNQALANLHGLPIAQIIGRSLGDLMQGKPMVSIISPQEAFVLLDEGQEVPDHTTQVMDQTYHVRVQGVRNATGQVVGQTVAMTNISKHLQVQHHLEKITEELTLTNRMLEDANGRLLRYAQRDYLTDLPNRRWFDEVFSTEVGRTQRNHGTLSVVMIDVDYFKKYNDHYGHLAGDECLRRVAHALQQAMQRPGDLVSRYGGEEFTLLLPDSSPEGALDIARRTLVAVEALGMEHKASHWGRVTASAGVTTLKLESQQVSLSMTIDQICMKLLAYADQALYQAKNSGRNRVMQTPAIVATVK